MSTSKLPERASLGYLRKLAKDRLEQLRRTEPEAKLATALLQVAREYGYPSWRALKSELERRREKDHTAKISCPVAVMVAVRDLAAATAFYRDVLGFAIEQEGDSAEAVLGPAQVRLTVAGAGAAGRAVLFLETADVVAARAAVVARGATASELVRVNWIKMRMFEVRDPEGNVLWFGQSYHENQESPSRRGAQPHGLWQALPELPFVDVAAAVDHYRTVLGFRINYQQDDLGVMDRDAVTVLLIQRTKEHKGIGSCEMFVADVDELYRELVSKGANVSGPPVSHPWGLRDFQVRDPEGNRITFAQTFE